MLRVEEDGKLEGGGEKHWRGIYFVEEKCWERKIWGKEIMMR